MELHLDDDGFVRAPAGACYGALADVASWGGWWPGTRTVVHADDHVEVHAPRRLVLDLALHGWRPDQGFHATVTGALTGTGEVWLEPGWGGTVVHHLWHVRGDRRRLLGLRRWVRTGLWGLKDRVQGELLTVGGGG